MPPYGTPQPYEPFLNRLPTTTPSSSGDVALWRGTTPTPSQPTPRRTATPSPPEIRQEGISIASLPSRQQAAPQRELATPGIPIASLPSRQAPSAPTAASRTANDSGAIPGMRPPAGPLLPSGQTRPPARNEAAVQAAQAARAADRAIRGDEATSAGAPSYGPEAFEPGAVMNWTDRDIAQITEATVGRPMSRDEFFGWVDAFTREHGQSPWQTGPFDAANNLIDHLIALGDSQRQAGRGQTVDWAGLYYNRYAAPTFAPGAPPNPRGDEPWQRLVPGQMANPLHPWWLMQGAMGNPNWYMGIRRPWFGG